MDLSRYELPKREKISLLIVIGLFAAWLIWGRLQRPDPHLVDGIYLNPCCQPLFFRNGVITQGKKTVPFDLELMKFGLTAYPSEPVMALPSTKLSIRVIGDPAKADKPPVFSFDDPDNPMSFTTADRDGHQLVFHRR